MNIKMNEIFDISCGILLYVGVCLPIAYLSFWIIRSTEPHAVELLVSLLSYNVEVPKALLMPDLALAFSLEGAYFFLLFVIFLTHVRLTD